MLRENCVTVYTHIRKNFESSYRSSHLEKMQKERQSKPKENCKRDILRYEQKSTKQNLPIIEIINKTKICFFEKINKINKLLEILI